MFGRSVPRSFSASLHHLPHQRVLQFQLLDPAVNASTSSPTALAFRLRRGAGLLVWLAFLFSGRNAAIPPSRYVLTQLRTAPSRSAARFRACRPAPVRSPWSRLQRDDGFRHMAGIPRILCQPAFQALPPGRITQMPHHLGRGHRRGGIQVHRAPSFLGTEHTIILSFSLQENVRSPISVLCGCRVSFRIAYMPIGVTPYFVFYKTARAFKVPTSI